MVLGSVLHSYGVATLATVGAFGVRTTKRLALSRRRRRRVWAQLCFFRKSSGVWGFPGKAIDESQLAGLKVHFEFLGFGFWA